MHPTSGLAISCLLLFVWAGLISPEWVPKTEPATSQAFQVSLRWQGRHLRSSAEELGPSRAALRP